MGDLRSATSFSRTLHYDIPSQFNAGSVSSKHPPLIPPPAPAKTISISKVIGHEELCRSSININITSNNKQDMLDKGGGEGRGLVEIAKNMLRGGSLCINSIVRSYHLPYSSAPSRAWVHITPDTQGKSISP